MKPVIVPISCGLVLTAISAAGTSHWWSVRQMIASGNPLSTPIVQPIQKVQAPAAIAAATDEKPIAPVATVAVANPGPTAEFYRGLIDEIKNLRNQNTDLLDQVAETNRDMRLLELRVDTHSDSFRPLKVSEDRQDTTLDESNGVLPPLEDPAALPRH